MYRGRIESKKWLIVLAAGSLMTACSPTQDMQGIDPVEYYSEHPIQNQVEMHSASELLRFPAGENRMENSQVDKLTHSLHGISAMAADRVTVHMSPAGMNDVRRKHLIAVLRSMGYSKDKISFETSSSLTHDQVRIDVQYAAIIPPNCPDWRTSPVTTYSNSTQGNFKCATTVNLGAMVADPRDLVRGNGNVFPDTQRSSLVAERYHGGQNPAAGAAASAGGASSADGAGGGSSQESLPDGGGQ